jgi:hypothetical protein
VHAPVVIVSILQVTELAKRSTLLLLYKNNPCPSVRVCGLRGVAFGADRVVSGIGSVDKLELYHGEHGHKRSTLFLLLQEQSVGDWTAATWRVTDLCSSATPCSSVDVRSSTRRS